MIQTGLIGIIGLMSLLALLLYLYGLGGVLIGVLLIGLTRWVTLRSRPSDSPPPISPTNVPLIEINDDQPIPTPELDIQLSDFKEFVDRLPIPAFIKDADSKTVYVNPYYESMFGRGWVGKSVWDYFPEAVARQMVEDDQAALQQGIHQITEGVPVPDGSGRIFRTIKFPLYRNGQPALLAGCGTDVTEGKLAEANVERINAQLLIANTELHYRQRNMQLLLELTNALQTCSSLPEISTVITQFIQQLFPQYAGLLSFAVSPNQDFQIFATWGVSPDIANLKTVPCQDCPAHKIHQNCQIKIGGDSQNKASWPGERCTELYADKPIYSICFPIYSLLVTPEQARDKMKGLLHLYQPNGNPISETILQLAKTTITSINLTLTNVELREALHEKSIRDPLTSLFNRRYLEETLHRELARAIRENEVISILVIDVDHFKKLNDTYGHAAGDKVLQELGQLLQSKVRQYDIACRYGGEEFVLVLPGVIPEIAYHRAEDIRIDFAKLYISYANQTMQATLSIGIAAYPMHGITYESLFNAADTAMYLAKSGGRNQVMISPNTEQPCRL